MSIEDRFKGCLVGLACGDYLGMPVEFMDPDQIKEVFGEGGVRPVVTSRNKDKPVGYYTDDTCLAICLAESLLRGFNVQDQFQTYRQWLYYGHATPDGGKSFGVGQRTLIAMVRQTNDTIPTKLVNNDKHGGNGAMMRSAPVGLRYYNDPEMLVKASILSAIVTHNSLLAAYSCVVLNKLISYALAELPKDQMLERLALELPDECPEQIRDLVVHLYQQTQFPNSGFTLDTLRIALYSFFTTDSYKGCITKAIFYGNDTDTQAAVAGALAGSYYGFDAIPELWRNTLMRKEYIADLAIKLYKAATKIHP